MTTLIDECFRQVSRDVEEGASGSEALTPLLRRLMTHFDSVHTGEGYTRLQSFGVCAGRLFPKFAGSSFDQYVRKCNDLLVVNMINKNLHNISGESGIYCVTAAV